MRTAPLVTDNNSYPLTKGKTMEATLALFMFALIGYVIYVQVQKARSKKKGGLFDDRPADPPDDYR